MPQEIEPTIAEWVLGKGRNTGSANALARVYLALSRADSVAPPFAHMVRGFDATRRGWFLAAMEAYAQGRWTGDHTDAVAAAYPAVVEALDRADEAFRTTLMRIDERRGRADEQPAAGNIQGSSERRVTRLLRE